jgi:hypothetical protein
MRSLTRSHTKCSSEQCTWQELQPAPYDTMLALPFLIKWHFIASTFLFTRDGHALVPVQTTADTTLKKMNSFFILKQYFVIEAHSDHVVLRVSLHYSCALLAPSVLPREHGRTNSAFRVVWLVWLIEVGVSVCTAPRCGRVGKQSRHYLSR